MTKITLINLPDFIASFFEGHTSVDLELPENFSIRLTKSVERLSILNTISTEGALGFSVPFTQRNNCLLSEYSTPVTLGGAQPFYDVRVQVNGTGLAFTRLWVKSKNDPNKEWDLELTRDPNHWVELSSQISPADLDFGYFALSESNIFDSWANNQYDGDPTDINSGAYPIYWPLVDYGGWCDLSLPEQQNQESAVKAVGVEDFRPWVSLRYILQAGFCKIGWTLQSVLFESEHFRRIWVYALKPDYYSAVYDQMGGRVVGGIFEIQNFDDGDKLSLDEVSVQSNYSVIDVSNPPQTIRFLGIKNHPNISLRYRFQMNGQFINDRSLPFVAQFGVYELEENSGAYTYTGELISPNTEDFEFEPGETKRIIFDQTLIFKPGQIGAIHIAILPNLEPGFKALPGLQFSITPENKSYMTGDVVHVRRSMSDEFSILDYLKACVHLCDGKLETDLETKTVTLYPGETSDFWGDIIPGFVLNESPVIDINHLVSDQSIKSSPIRQQLKRNTRLQFKQSSDAYIQSLNLPFPLHSRTYLNGIDLPNEIEEISNLVFEPSAEGSPIGLASGAGNRNPLPNLIRLWDNTNNERSFNIGPRIAYSYGAVQQINPSPITPISTLTSFFFNYVPNNSNDGLATVFGYLTQSPTWEITPTPEKVLHLVFGTKEKDLFTTFYLGFSQSRKYGTLIDLLMMLNLNNYNEYNFRRLFKFTIKGLPIIAQMTGIRDFSSETPGLTPVSFSIPPALLNCCELPCGCQFLECEYYQDFGIYIRQSTLNTYNVSSFIVDGIEILSEPVLLGIVKFIDIAGSPYFTTLVDTLNSIGASYFTFSYSNRTHPDKGLRFFKIKRLLCTTFEIIISDGATPKYKYTNDSQEQKVFALDWEPMGYNSEFTDVPENCIQTTEY